MAETPSYLVVEDVEVYVKLGKSIDAQIRRGTLNTGNPRPLTILAVSSFTEGELHKRFEEINIKEGGGTEWFKMKLSEVIELACEMREAPPIQFPVVPPKVREVKRESNIEDKALPKLLQEVRGISQALKKENIITKTGFIEDEFTDQRVEFFEECLKIKMLGRLRPTLIWEKYMEWCQDNDCLSGTQASFFKWLTFRFKKYYKEYSGTKFYKMEFL
jgi:hypothetical protein